MLILKILFRFYVNASIHVALAVISLYVLSTQNLNILVNKNFLGFLFFSTIVCYNFVKYGVEAEKYFIVAKPAHRPIQAFSFLTFGFCLYFFFQLPVLLWPYIVLLTVVSALYAIPFLPRSKNLRSLGGLKIFLVALVWTGFVVVIPAIEQDILFSQKVLVQVAQVFLLVLTLILPFEIRDLKYDNEALMTLPQRWGVLRTKQFGYLLALLILVMGIFQANGDVTRITFAILTPSILVLALYFTKEEQSTYYTSFWVEGIPILLLLINVVL